MNPKALRKVQQRFKTAADSVQALGTAEDFDAFSRHWSVFLHASKGIYTALEQGAKVSPQARQWFGRKNQARKQDPVLRYVTEARNDDEHGLEELVEKQPSLLVFGANRPGASGIVRDQFGNVFAGNGRGAISVEGNPPPQFRVPQLTSLDGKPVAVDFTPERVALTVVHDRDGRPYDPPTVHAGKSLDSGSPEEVAHLMLKYLEGMISEAEGFDRP